MSKAGTLNNPTHDAVDAAARHILRLILENYHGPVALRLWNGETVIGDNAARCTIVFRHPAVLRDLVLHHDPVRLAEAHLASEVDVVGDMEVLFDLGGYLYYFTPSWYKRLQALWCALRLPNRGAVDIPRKQSARKTIKPNTPGSIAHHYDVSNDFYRLWLDPEMVYSCAYFRDAGQTLAEAQRDKLDYICRKLRLAPGQTLLDIGCGWGALPIWAARHYDVQAHGITLSEQQYAIAVERVRTEGLEEQVKIELLDYRDLPGDVHYDRVVSVGMFEHVGVANFSTYFSAVKRALKPGGLFLNHGITNDTGWRNTPLTSFINHYVFPDGELARISDVIDAMEQAGFEIIDTEGLRRHYAMTLRYWIKALEAHREQALTMVDEATWRIWRLYMAGSAYYFNEGSINVYQVLAGHVYQSLPTPLRRDDLYIK